MPAPTFVTSYSVSSYTTNTSPKTVSVTTLPGDIVVVYGGSEDAAVTLGTPSGNGITFTLEKSIVVTSFAGAYLWTGVDSTGGTNWTLSVTRGGSGRWGFSCLIFRDSDGIGVSNKNNSASGLPSVSLTTTQDNSAIVFFDADWNAQPDTGRSWTSVNSITPTSGNGMERDSVYLSGAWSAFGAYYTDAGTAGVKTPGMGAPSSQKWSAIAIEIKGQATVIQPIETFVDTFTGAVIDTSKWTASVGVGGVQQTNNELVMPLPVSQNTPYTYLESVNSFDLTGSRVFIECTGFVNPNQGSEMQLVVIMDSTHSLTIMFDGGLLGTGFEGTGANTDYITRDTVQHRWFQIREQSGTIYWETSPDHETWTVRKSAAAPFDVTSVKVRLRAGTWQSVASPGIAKFDNLNYFNTTATIAWFGA